MLALQKGLLDVLLLFMAFLNLEKHMEGSLREFEILPSWSWSLSLV